METNNFKAAIDSDQLREERVRTAFLIAIGLAAFVSFVFFLSQHSFPVHIAKEPEPVVSVVDTYKDVVLTAKAAIVFDLSNGQVLYGKNAEAQLPLASLTKLLTVYAAVDTFADNATITISETALAQEGDTGLIAGDRFSLKELARFALVASSNDAAAAISEAAENKHAYSGATLLASAATAAGLTQTYAVNGTGLDESLTVSGGYGSAHDIAVLSGGLLAKAPDIVEATTHSSVTVTSLDGRTLTQKNTNQEVPTVPGALLSKTGYTDLAGGNLAVVFDAAINHPIAIVVLGSTREGRFTDVDRLLDATLEKFATMP